LQTETSSAFFSFNAGSASFFAITSVRVLRKRLGTCLSLPLQELCKGLKKITVSQSHKDTAPVNQEGSPVFKKISLPRKLRVVNNASNFHEEHDRVSPDTEGVQLS